MSRHDPEIVFIVTFKEVDGTNTLTLSGPEADNCLVSEDGIEGAKDLAARFVNSYYGGDVVKDVTIEGEDDE